MKRETRSRIYQFPGDSAGGEWPRSPRARAGGGRKVRLPENGVIYGKGLLARRPEVGDRLRSRSSAGQVPDYKFPGPSFPPTTSSLSPAGCRARLPHPRSIFYTFF